MTPPPTPSPQQSGVWKFLTIVLLIAVLLLGWWQCLTWRYLRDDLRVWIEQHGGGDGVSVPKPPPRL